jgi:hypothetical protein
MVREQSINLWNFFRWQSSPDGASLDVARSCFYALLRERKAPARTHTAGGGSVQAWRMKEMLR